MEEHSAVWAMLMCSLTTVQMPLAAWLHRATESNTFKDLYPVTGQVPVTYYIDSNQLKPVENVMDIAYRDVTNPSHVSSTIQASDGSTINPTCVHAPSSTDSAVTLGNFRINLSGSIKSLIARYCSEEHTNTWESISVVEERYHI